MKATQASTFSRVIAPLTDAKRIMLAIHLTSGSSRVCLMAAFCTPLDIVLGTDCENPHALQKLLITSEGGDRMGWARVMEMVGRYS